jgi:hypothetical protein
MKVGTAMLNDITHALPQVIVDHVAAINNHDPEGLIATFSGTHC